MKNRISVTIFGPTGSRKTVILHRIEAFLKQQGLEPEETFRNHGITASNEPWEIITWEWTPNLKI